MEFRENISLKPYNTFGVEASAEYFGVIRQSGELSGLLSWRSPEKPMLILGEGSNILFVGDFPGIVLHNALKGIDLIEENADDCLLKVSAGENWSDFVDYTVELGWGGIENLSLIPGTVGAAPIQNIGAYGAELGEVLVNVEACNLLTGEIKVFSNEECYFGYRTSIFKTTCKGQFLVTSITLQLSKNPKLNLRYAPLKKAFEDRKIQDVDVREVSNAVKEIRRSKLPDPEKIGNAGSFFKNPVVKQLLAEALQKEFPDIPVYPAEAGRVKVAAGWLIEQSGWKGRRFGDAGVHEKQALVLVNYGDATGAEIYALSESIRKDVESKFGISMEREVTVVRKKS